MRVTLVTEGQAIGLICRVRAVSAKQLLYVRGQFCRGGRIEYGAQSKLNAKAVAGSRDQLSPEQRVSPE